MQNAIEIKDAIKSRVLADEEISDTQVYRWMSECKNLAETMEPSLGGRTLGPGTPMPHMLRRINVLAGSGDHSPGVPDGAGKTSMFLPPQIIGVRKATLDMGTAVSASEIGLVFGTDASGFPPCWFFPCTTTVGTSGITDDSVGRDLVPYLTSTWAHAESELENRGVTIVEDSNGDIEYQYLGDEVHTRFGLRHPNPLNTFSLEYRSSSEIKFYEGDSNYRFEQDPWGGLLVTVPGAGLIPSVQSNYHRWKLDVIMRSPDYGERDYSTIGGRPFGSATGSWNEDLFTKQAPMLLYYGGLWKAFEFLDDDEGRAQQYKMQFMEQVAAFRRTQRSYLYYATPGPKRYKIGRGAPAIPAAVTTGS